MRIHRLITDLVKVSLPSPPHLTTKHIPTPTARTTTSPRPLRFPFLPPDADVGQALQRLYLEPAPNESPAPKLPKPSSSPAQPEQPKPPAKASPQPLLPAASPEELAAAASDELPPLLSPHRHALSVGQTSRRHPESPPGSPTLKLVGQRSVGWHRHRLVAREDAGEDSEEELESFQLPESPSHAVSSGVSPHAPLSASASTPNPAAVSSGRSLNDEQAARRAEAVHVFDWDERVPAADSEDGARISLYRQMSTHVPQLIPVSAEGSSRGRVRVCVDHAVEDVRMSSLAMRMNAWCLPEASWTWVCGFRLPSLAGFVFELLFRDCFLREQALAFQNGVDGCECRG